jgi:hypothetical protein
MAGYAESLRGGSHDNYGWVPEVWERYVLRGYAFHKLFPINLASL